MAIHRHWRKVVAVEECWSCLSNSGQRRISPGRTIGEGRYWLVEHAFPTKVAGWLVLVLKRHCERLHELTADEFDELGPLLFQTSKVLSEALHCEKEYVAQFAEVDHFHHVHFHVIPKRAGLPPEAIGAGVFRNVAGDALSEDEVRNLCEVLAARLSE
jgi:diadenosine tetraphosphate (Ap4A) HIT family hydrolase